MADTFTDHDSAFGDDDLFWFNSMFPATAPVAGTKRDADSLTQSASSGQRVHRGPKADLVDPRVPQCCANCPDPCPEAACDVRPSKRRASNLKAGACTAAEPHSNLDADCQFPDDCFEKFCQECNLDTSCPPDCSVPVPCPAEAECTTPDACWDPHCDQEVKECSDGCVDPECTKISCPEKPCFCQKCHVEPCPLGDPSNECHFAHSAPTNAGTIYCYDTAPCHFQEGYHGHDQGLSSFETYPCFSQAHGYVRPDDVNTQASSAPTPALSNSNFTSLDSAFTTDASPTTFSNCFLGISGEHCHIDNSCCHGQERACGEHPSASPQQLELWNTATAQGNGLANTMMNFGFDSSHPTSPMTTTPNAFSNHLDSSMLGFHDHSWMFDPSLPTGFQPDMMGFNKLDFLASAVQQDILKSGSTLQDGSLSLGPTSGPTHSASLGTSDAPCICKWQHAPGALCLAVFPNPELLHKHTKSAHVDNCSSCFCQWEDCESSSKDFKQRSKLSRHLLGHAGYRPYACSYPDCNKTFATNQAKDNHERTHTGERPYVCDRCGYTTTTHTQLQTHISALHEGKKPHKCRFCDFTCADSSNLSKHERTHQTLRPYRCPHAGCTFKPDCRWENLKRHLRRSGHCPELLEETSEEYTSYREGVRREIEEWHRRNGDGGIGKVGRRKRG